MSKDYRLIIFDWDGTLSNSVTRIVESMHHAIAQMGWPARQDNEIANIIGLGLPEALRILYPEIETADLEQMRVSYSQQFINGYDSPSPLYEGVEESLQQLLGSGYMLAVATGKSRRGMERIFRDTDWQQYFAAFRCADETRSKPHPLMLHELMQELTVPVDQVLMVGDSEYDLEMAANAGVDSAAVSYGVHGLDRLRRHRPKFEVDSIAELTAGLVETVTWKEC